MNCTKAKKIDIIITLKNLGHTPVKETENEAWFLSPFRNETHPSFKVQKQKNVFYDFGLGFGGNLVDLLAKLMGSVDKALVYLSDNKVPFSFHQQPLPAIKKQSSISIKNIKTIQHFGLVDYLNARNIPVHIARCICKEVHFELKGKRYFSIGLKNSLGGWELRNRYFKSGSSPKGISLIENGSDMLVVTEGMFDMLSLLAIDNSLLESMDLLVLNSCSFYSKVADYTKRYKTVKLYLDNDSTGRTITEKLMGSYENIKDEASLYEGYTDINEWWTTKAAI